MRRCGYQLVKQARRVGVARYSHMHTTDKRKSTLRRAGSAHVTVGDRQDHMGLGYAGRIARGIVQRHGRTGRDSLGWAAAIPRAGGQLWDHSGTVRSASGAPSQCHPQPGL